MKFKVGDSVRNNRKDIIFINGKRQHKLIFTINKIEKDIITLDHSGTWMVLPIDYFEKYYAKVSPFIAFLYKFSQKLLSLKNYFLKFNKR